MMSSNDLIFYYDIYSQFFYIDYLVRFNRSSALTPSIVESYNIYRSYFACLVDDYGEESIKQMRNYYQAFSTRKRRLRKRITQLLNTNNCYFLTLTFSDEFVNAAMKNKNQWCRRYLSKYSIKWLYNSDWGDANGRHHFHCVIADPVTDIEPGSWKYGFMNIQKCNDQSVKLSNYIDKLTNHGVKESVHCSHVSYSSKFDWN